MDSKLLKANITIASIAGEVLRACVALDKARETASKYMQEVIENTEQEKQFEFDFTKENDLFKR